MPTTPNIHIGGFHQRRSLPGFCAGEAGVIGRCAESDLLIHFFYRLSKTDVSSSIKQIIFEFNDDSSPLLYDTYYHIYNRSDQFSNFFNAYAKTINKAYGRIGSLFQHPFGRVPITTDNQFWNVIAYIHQNPQKHGFVKDFRDWKYSSYGTILDLNGNPTPVKRNEVMKWFGTRDDYFTLHNQWMTDAQAKWFIGDLD